MDEPRPAGSIAFQPPSSSALVAKRRHVDGIDHPSLGPLRTLDAPGHSPGTPTSSTPGLGRSASLDTISRMRSLASVHTATVGRSLRHSFEQHAAAQEAARAAERLEAHGGGGTRQPRCAPPKGGAVSTEFMRTAYHDTDWEEFRRAEAGSLYAKTSDASPAAFGKSSPLQDHALGRASSSPGVARSPEAKQPTSGADEDDATSPDSSPLAAARSFHTPVTPSPTRSLAHSPVRHTHGGSNPRRAVRRSRSFSFARAPLR